jgi:hypothetical protein
MDGSAETRVDAAGDVTVLPIVPFVVGVSVLVLTTLGTFTDIFFIFKVLFFFNVVGIFRGIICKKAPVCIACVLLKLLAS